jgi:hypothetical protein
MNYECERVKDDDMNFEVKHPKSWKLSSKHNNAAKVM